MTVSIGHDTKKSLQYALMTEVIERLLYYVDVNSIIGLRCPVYTGN